MPPNLHTLPFDIIFAILPYLGLEDVVRLGTTCRQLETILRESTLCRRAIEISANHSYEAELARSCKLTWQRALRRIHLRRSAFSAADPYSACVIARGTHFIYDGGTLCTLHDDEIVVRDLHLGDNRWTRVNVDDLHQVLAERGCCREYSVQLLHFSHGVLSLQLSSDEDYAEEEHFLVALDLDNAARELGKLLLVRRLEEWDRLFVRNDAEYLYWGTHSRLGSHGHHEWIIKGAALRDTPELPLDNCVQLDDFVGCEIGTTVAFRIHDGYFYALSNQTSFTVEEVDWTALYTVVWFPVANPSRHAVKTNSEIFRRQHVEGPIHDLWTDLSLQLDEETNELMIVESRREWLDGGSVQSRTFYTQHIPPPAAAISHEDESDEEAVAGPSSENMQYPADDPYVNVLTSDNHPHWMQSQPRQPRQVHEEYAREGETARSFILAKTKHRAYNLSCSSFVELVEDTFCCNPSGMSACLRLRMGSRRAIPQVESAKWYRENPDTSTSRHAARKLYRYSHIRLWPPEEGSPLVVANKGDLHGILNPHLDPAAPVSSAVPVQIHGVSDERSLVYMVRPARPRCDADRVGAIVLISFDPYMQAVGHGERLTWRRECRPCDL